MKGTTYEATVQNDRVVLPEEAHIPDNTRVYVVVPDADDAHRVRMMTPRPLTATFQEPNWLVPV